MAILDYWKVLRLAGCFDDAVKPETKVGPEAPAIRQDVRRYGHFKDTSSESGTPRRPQCSLAVPSGRFYSSGPLKH